MKILGIDFGLKKIGLAVADSEIKLAIPRLSFRYDKKEEVLEKITKMINEENFSEVVVGLPLDFNFQETEMSALVRDFSKNLGKKIDKPIFLENEIFSSSQAESEAENFLRKRFAGRNRKINDRKNLSEMADLDSRSAAIILQSYLNRRFSSSD